MQEALGFLLAHYLRFVQAHQPLRRRAGRSRCGDRRPDAADRRDVARPASDDFLRLAAIDRADGRADFAQRRRRRPGGGAAPARRRAGARLGRPRRRARAKGGAPALRELLRAARQRRLGGDDRRRAQARARRRARHRHAGAAFRPADRRRRRWSPAGGSISNPGIAPASACRSGAARSSSAISSTSPPTPTRRRWRRRARAVEDGARRRPRARLCHGRRARSRRRPEAAHERRPLSLVAYRLATRACAPLERRAAVAAAQQGQGGPAADRRAARRRRPRAARRGRWSGCTARASARRCRCCR